MGIHGLWKLLEPAGKDVTLESLENKVLAIDVSLWLHQAQQGTSSIVGGVNAPNAHLLTLFHRISKLLFYRIKPIFVFDGVAPELKKKTILARNQRKQLANDRAKEIRQQLLLSLVKSGEIKSSPQKGTAKIVAESSKPKRGHVKQGLEDDLYHLPPLPAPEPSDEVQEISEDSYGSDEDDNLMGYCEDSPEKKKKANSPNDKSWKKWSKWVDPHEVDVLNKEFKALPVEVRREILTDLKAARKESSWGRLHKMPKNLDNFSSFQMSRLLHRRKVQEVLEDVEKELSMNEMKGTSLVELEEILAGKGVDVTSGISQINQRIASDENKGFILISGLKDQNIDKKPVVVSKSELNVMAGIKEEPMDDDDDISELEIIKTIEFEEEKGKVLRGKMRSARSESLNEPSAIETEMLNQNNKVKDFIRITVKTSDNESDEYDGSAFENSNSCSEGIFQEGLSQEEILAMIKSQAEENPPSVFETIKHSKSEIVFTIVNKNVEQIIENLEVKSDKLSDKTVKVEEVKSGGLVEKETKEEKHAIPDILETDDFIDQASSDKLVLLEAEKVCEDAKTCGKPNSSNRKTSEIISEICGDTQLEEEPSQVEIMAMIKDQSITKTKSTDQDDLIFGKIKGEVSFSLANKSVTKDLKNKSSSLEEEEVKVDAKEEDGFLTQAEIMTLINSQSTNKETAKEIIDIAVSEKSESDESDFLEVEEVVEETEPDDLSDITELKGKNQSVSLKDSPLEGKLVKKNNLEVVVHLDVSSDDSNDIFADVFQGNKVEEEVDGVHHDSSQDDITCIDETSTVKNNMPESKKPNSITNISEKNEIHASEEKESEELVDEEEETAIAVEKYTNEERKSETDILTEEEEHRLRLEMRKMEREASAGVTEKARLESQELLGLFGVPWVIAPFEAEAQCAFLESASPKTSQFASTSSYRKFLAEGTVTEDSDVWAFGASYVYRHVFDRRRTRVRVYSKQEIYKRFGLNRVQVVQLALLTGSDYTIGLPGVGTVTALEILAAFPGEKEPHASSSSESEVEDVISGLEHFADWWKRVEMNDRNGAPIGYSYFDPSPAVSQTLKRRLTACWKAVVAKQPGASLLPPGFPSRAVIQAYLKPTVDECKDTFIWLKPDETALRSYAQLHFGWTKERTDSVLRPLFARLKLSDNKDRTQTSLHSFFSHVSNTAFPIDLEGTNISVRTQKALERIAGKCDDLVLSPNKKVAEKKEGERSMPQGGSDKGVRKRPVKQSKNPGIISSIKSTHAADRKSIKKAAIEVNSSTVKNPAIKETGFSSSLYTVDKIPQREKECASALQSKLKAIEVLRKSSMGKGKRAGKDTNRKGQVKKLKRAEVPLSESSDSD